MRFRHAFTITTDNFVETLKLLLYRLVSVAIFGSIAYVILKLGLSAITHSAEAEAFKSVLGNFFNALFTGETDVLKAFRETFKTTLSDLLVMIGSHSGSIVGCAVGLVAIYLLSRFVNGLAVFALGGVLSDRMRSYAHTKFSQSFFKNIGSAALYQVIYVPLGFVYDMIAALACWFFFFYAPSLMPSWGVVTVIIAVSLTILAMVCFIAVKLALISAWMPAVIAGGVSVGKAFASSVKRGKGFGGRFVGFVTAIYAVVVVNLVAAFCTVGSSLLITVPASYVFVLAMQFVNYFRDENMRYFVTRRRIVGEEEEGFDPEPPENNG